MAILMAAVSSNALDRETIDNLIFLLGQPEPVHWSEMDIDDAILLEGFNEIYIMAVGDEDDMLRLSVIAAMGETGLVDFADVIIEELEVDPLTACYALGKIASEDGVTALMEYLDHEDMFIREASVWALGKVPYTSSMEEAKEDALVALNNRLEEEGEDWILELIDAAIIYLETGVVTNPAFESRVDGLIL